jgi:hypothetical protein
MPGIGVLTSGSGFAGTDLAVGTPQMSVLAPHGVPGSSTKLRVSYDVPSFLGGLEGRFPGLPARDLLSWRWRRAGILLIVQQTKVESPLAQKGEYP